jgi:crossover junction endodeoxyribonuclease RusA
MMQITLPWPPRCLHPNDRSHWRIVRAAAKTARGDAFLLTRSAMARGRPLFGDDSKVYLRLTFCPPNRRKHDIDGCLSANKAALDGIADALGVDDSRFSLRLDRGPVVKGGAVYVEVHA